VATRARSRIGLALFAAAGFPLAAAAGSPTVPASLFLEPIGSYRERVPQGPENACRRSIAEIAAYDPLTRRVFVTNAADRSLDILDIGDPTRPRLVRRVELGAYGLPTSVIDLRGGPAGAKAATAGFEAFDADALRARGVRVFGPGADGAKDLEPEFIAVSPDSETAWVTLQENNALAVLDVEAAKITDVFGLGTKDHHAAGSGLDASDEDGAIDIAAWPVAGLYQPDAIAAYWSFGRTYLVTANEGDPRGYGAFEEAKRVADLTLDPSLLAGNPDLQENDRLGRLQVSPVDADTDGDGDVDRLQAFGGRSFSIWREDGALIFDSGDVLERLTAAPELYAPAANLFNTPDDENVFDERSDARGPEPEGVTVGMLGLRTIAFLALERASGILVVDITRPDAPVRQQYIDTRDHSEDPQDVGGADADLFVNCDAGDLGPEGVLFIPAQLSPIWRPLLVVAFETSGSTTVFRIAAGRR
jgi:hypothetical protein